MTCKDCIHYNVCHRRINSIDFLPVIKGKVSISSIMYKKCDNVEKHCLHFKDESLVVELPYKIGTKVYVISSQTSDNHNLFIFKDIIDRYIIDENDIIMCFTNHFSKSAYRNKYNVWDRVFTDKSKAEAKLKELNENV